MGVRTDMRQRAEADIQARVTAGETLLEANHRLEELAEQQAVAVREYRDAWAKAVKSGWTVGQLNSYGLKAVDAKVVRAPRKRRPTRTQTPDQGQEAHHDERGA